MSLSLYLVQQMSFFIHQMLSCIPKKGDDVIFVTRTPCVKLFQLWVKLSYILCLVTILIIRALNAFASRVFVILSALFIFVSRNRLLWNSQLLMTTPCFLAKVKLPLLYLWKQKMAAFNNTQQFWQFCTRFWAKTKTKKYWSIQGNCSLMNVKSILWM